MPLDPTWVKAAANENDTAIVIIGRSAGEDRETKLEPGSYYLTEAEEQMLRTVTDQFDDVIVLLNSGNIFDMAWLDYPQIDALLYIWQGGMQGAKAVADILSGDLSPSGNNSNHCADLRGLPDQRNEQWRKSLWRLPFQRLC